MAALCILVQLYFLVLLARIVLSWFPVSPQSAIATVYHFCYTLTEPILGPLRRIIPPLGVGGMGLDLSPIVVFLVIELVVAPALHCRLAL